jgi:CheY-like chemotaxis protein
LVVIEITRRRLVRDSSSGAQKLAQTGTPIRVRQIVIVDDDPGMRLVARMFAEDEGCVVVGEAADGLEAVHLVRRLEPDLVLMDFHMPELDGVAATRRILRSRPDTMIIGWSNDEAPTVGEQFRAAGAIACAQKGDFETLRVLLSDWQPA